MASYSDKTALWFHRPTTLNQPLFQMPALGYISGLQATLMFGVGLPVFFGVMNSFGVWAALVPFGAVSALALIRPPILGYEGRLFVRVLFHLRRRHPAKRKCSSLVIPVRKKIGASRAMRAKGKTADTSAEPKRPKKNSDSPLVVRSSGRPVEISMLLRTYSNAASRRKVRILLDGAGIKTALPSKSGRVSVILHPDECAGRRRISIHEVTGDDRAGDLLTQKEVVFIQ